MKTNMTPNRRRILIEQLTNSLEYGLYPAIEAATNNKAPKRLVKTLQSKAAQICAIRDGLRKE